MLNAGKKRGEREEKINCIFSVVHQADSIYFHVIICIPGESRRIVGVLIAGISPLISSEGGKVLRQLSPRPETEGATLQMTYRKRWAFGSGCVCAHAGNIQATGFIHEVSKVVNGK